MKYLCQFLCMFSCVNVYANWDGQIGTYVYCMSTAWSILILYHYTALMSENDRLFKAFSGMNLRNISTYSCDFVASI